MKLKVTDIEDRNHDYSMIEYELLRTELGLRSICVMYDQHSSDKKSHENIFLLKDNIEYRLFSAAHQYLIFLRELNVSERYLEKIYKDKPELISSYFPENPYFGKVELELSSIFDSIIFQLSSVFDYFSHLICYICKTDKSKTLYWTKLASSVRGEGNEFSDLKIKKCIDDIDRKFVGRLYDYRSRLLHNKRDRHNFTTSLALHHFNFNVKIMSSSTSLKIFKIVRELVPEGEITLTYLSSWLVKQSFRDIEIILDALKDHISSNSCFYNNLRNPKVANALTLLTINPTTRMPESASEGLWKQYKQKKLDARS